MKYPKYEKQQKLNCKLNENDIVEIVRAYNEGITGVELAKRFGVVRSTIYRYTNPEAAKRYDKMRYEWQKLNDTKEDKLRRHKKYKVRKRSLMPEFSKYLYSLNKNWKIRNTKKNKEHYKKWYSLYGAKYYGKKRDYKKWLKDDNFGTNKQRPK